MRKWWPLVAVSLGVFMLLVDVTIVIVALPGIGSDLKTSLSDLQWVMDGYALTLAALLLGAGSLADKSGRRRVYVGGLSLFAVASLVCGIAQDPAVLIAARAVQGIGAAAMLATAMALLNITYQGKDRGIAFGVWGAVSGAAAAVGPVLGGLLTEYFGWRWIFLVNLPVSIAAIALALAVLPESRNPKAGRMDLAGIASFSVTVGSLVFVLIRGGTGDWTSATTIGFGTLAVVALAAFLVIETRSSHPMLDLSLFRRAPFLGVMLCSLLFSAVAFAYLPYTSLWVQSVLELSPVSGGLVVLPMSAVAFVVSALAGKRLPRVPAWLALGGGLALIGAGSLLQARLDADASWTALIPGLVLTGFGVGVVSPVLAATAMAAVPPERGGMASGSMNTFRQLGQALGIAVLGVVLQQSLTRALDSAGGAGLDPSAATALGSGQAHQVIAEAPAGQLEAVGHLVRSSFAEALNDVMFVSGITGLIGAVVVVLLIRKAPAAARPAAATAPAPVAETNGVNGDAAELQATRT
ncbi:MFS transporter [Streptomyces sp. H34-S4]|uniref:MFS transporter n=1 Tax=Streptomyces sp. H34-S4 TaxID=2996463 RepID=UPI00226E32F2|nr:MFS transporter [Streptomyces sp. H34-S4]MCY0935131.1 MFS transporter [Streptomyces sp. H34-S4]